MTTQQPEALALADEVRHSMPPDVIKLWAAEAAGTIRRQHARITELEAQLSAIGAGGVSPLMNAAQETEATHLRELAAYQITVENLEREIASQQPAPSATAAEWLEQAFREGWAACRDSEFAGEEAEEWSFGSSQANGRMIDIQQAAPAAQADTQPAPALWVSPEQFANLTNTQAPFGTYLPARKTSAGKFTMPLFAARAPEDSVQEDALSDSVRTPLDSLHADAAYLIGRLREGSMPYARVIEIIRERIDAAKAAIRASAAHGQAPAGATEPTEQQILEAAFAPAQPAAEPAKPIGYLNPKVLGPDGKIDAPGALTYSSRPCGCWTFPIYAAAPAQPAAQQGVAYAALPGEVVRLAQVAIRECQYKGNDMPQDWMESAMRACRLIAASHGQAPATQQAREVSDAMVLAALQMQHPAAYGQYLRHPANGPKTSIRAEAEIDTARRMISAALAAAPQPHTAPATQQPEGEVVAYLDVGANGYLDLGSELSEDALQQLPKGRHALVIAGTYGIDGYVAAPQPSPSAQAESAQEDAARLTSEQEHAIRQGHEIAASDRYFEARPQIDSNDRRNVFQAGFERGWDAARKQGEKQ